MSKPQNEKKNPAARVTWSGGKTNEIKIDQERHNMAKSSKWTKKDQNPANGLRNHAQKKEANNTWTAFSTNVMALTEKK